MGRPKGSKNEQNPQHKDKEVLTTENIQNDLSQIFLFLQVVHQYKLKILRKFQNP